MRSLSSSSPSKSVSSVTLAPSVGSSRGQAKYFDFGIDASAVGQGHSVLNVTKHSGKEALRWTSCLRLLWNDVSVDRASRLSAATAVPPIEAISSTAALMTLIHHCSQWEMGK